MGSWVHTTILATVIAATATVALASVALVAANGNAPAAKADRLPVIADADGYVTIETRHDGVSVLRRIAVN